MALATVVSDIAPLYEKSSTENKRLDEVLFGMSVQVIDESESGWCYLRTEYGTEGYSPAACFEINTEVASAWRKYPKNVVLAPYIDVQQNAVAEAARIASVPRGGLVVPLGQPGINGWQKVGLPTGAVGYTRSSYIGEAITDWTKISPADMRWNIVETALSYNGTALRTGGRTPLGIDAIGLASMAYLLNGVNIHRDLFIKPGLALHSIPQKRMEEGDLIFFQSSVGVYMGDNRFVHATDYAGGEGVVVSSLRSKDNDFRGDLAKQIVSIGSLF